MTRVFLLALLLSAASTFPALAGSANLDAPPAGIAPNPIALSQILKNYTAAVGKRPAGAPQATSESWTFTKAGANGTETLVRDGLDYYSRITTGPLVDEYGQFLGHGWHRDANGVTSPVQSPDYTSFQMLLFTDSFDDALDPKNDVKVLGEVRDPQPAYVVEIKQTGEKHPEWVFYDEKSALIDRIVRIIDDRKATVTYDDYRKTKGISQPWHLHFTDGVAALDDDFTRKTLQIGAPAGAKQFAMPPSTFPFESYAGHLSLPAKVYEDLWPIDIGHDRYHVAQSPTLVVRLNVNGRGLDFAFPPPSPSR